MSGLQNAADESQLRRTSRRQPFVVSMFTQRENPAVHDGVDSQMLSESVYAPQRGSEDP